MGVGGKACPNIGIVAYLWLCAFAVPHEGVHDTETEGPRPTASAGHAGSGSAPHHSAPGPDRATRNLDGSLSQCPGSVILTAQPYTGE